MTSNEIAVEIVERLIDGGRAKVGLGVPEHTSLASLLRDYERAKEREDFDRAARLANEGSYDAA